ncbi:hypothetical protein E2C01_058429 [Portunus trituberculatus]|uniref:Uncharacterized protein n=1 Tax=Portunus trituberculatus TaxID=210409 RepID=A0A5B7H357_PORTR|nr:hypothetical protein [Portunus trituberculatus]
MYNLEVMGVQHFCLFSSSTSVVFDLTEAGWGQFIACGCSGGSDLVPSLQCPPLGQSGELQATPSNVALRLPSASDKISVWKDHLLFDSRHLLLQYSSAIQVFPFISVPYNMRHASSCTHPPLRPCTRVLCRGNEAGLMLASSRPWERRRYIKVWTAA